jgi:hypothetical protein
MKGMISVKGSLISDLLQQTLRDTRSLFKIPLTTKKRDITTIIYHANLYLLFQNECGLMLQFTLPHEHKNLFAVL